MKKQRRVSTTYKRALVSNKGVEAKFDSHCGKLKDDLMKVKGRLNAEQTKFLRDVKCKLPAISITNQLTGDCVLARASPLKPDKVSIQPLIQERNQLDRNDSIKAKSAKGRELNYEGFKPEEARSTQKAGFFLQPSDSLTENGMAIRRRSEGILPEKAIKNSKSFCDLYAKFRNELNTPARPIFTSRSSGSLTILVKDKESRTTHDIKNSISQQERLMPTDCVNEESRLPPSLRPKSCFTQSKPTSRRIVRRSTFTGSNPNELLVCENTNQTALDTKLSSSNRSAINSTTQEVEFYDLCTVTSV